METLERVLEVAQGVLGGVGRSIERGITGIFGSSNARYIRKLQPRVDAISALEPKYQAMSDAVLREQTELFRARFKNGETLEDLLVEAFAVCREAGRRWIGLRHYDVQMMGGMVLHAGNIAEMVTGEGKTLVATLPAYLNALSGQGVHVVTVNSYLARRDMEWMGPLYMGLGLSVGAIFSDQEAEDKQKAYLCDITYGTNNEFGFDYLRDNMKPAAQGDDRRYPKWQQQCQRKLHYAIIDEVDNILIDEARTPLIISGPSDDDVTRYPKADKVAHQLKRDLHFEVKEKEHSAHLTDEGVREAERLAGVESFYTAGNMDWPHLIDNALKAHHLYKRDVNYVVDNGEVIIVDEFTGRLMPGRHWSDGLHQAVEAKEGVKIKEESQTYATITLQNFFKLYDKISGMTGTAMTEAAEFWKIYKLDVIAIPTNRALRRANHPDVIYRTEREKYAAIVDEIERMHKWDVIEKTDASYLVGTLLREENERVEIESNEDRAKVWVKRGEMRSLSRRGRPILVGTISIEKSERLSDMLGRRGIKHEVLNAKHHQREAEIIAQAGRKNAVTIATNMAGRGTDIILGGNPETMAWGRLQSKYPTRLDVPQQEWIDLVAEIEHQEQMKNEGEVVKVMGGLHIVGTERHEARRIDLQLRGRCGRQGDPGTSRFFLSLEDDLMRIFAGEWVKNVLTRLGMQEGEAIESGMVTRRIEGAQKKVEERNFEVRKSLLEYDEVMDEQRKRVYGFRQAILGGVNLKAQIMEMIDHEIDEHLTTILDKDYGTASYAGWLAGELGIQLEARDFRGMDAESAERHARDAAERQAETQVLEAIEENLPQEEDESEWNWEAFATTAKSRWRLDLRDRDLKKIGRGRLDESLIEQARESIQKVDLGRGGLYLDPDFSLRSAVSWVHGKFGIDLAIDDVRGLEPADFKRLVMDRALAAYEEKEVVYPVMAGLAYFTTRDPATGHKRYDREKLIEWARHRFEVELDLEDLKNKQRDEIRDVLIEHSRRSHQRAAVALAEVEAQVERLFSAAGPTATVAEASGGNGALESLTHWFRERLDLEIPSDEVRGLDRASLLNSMTMAVEERFRPEIRRMERALVLETLDTAWKRHLLTMDHLRSSVGLVGYAQVDPKVEYKREGMKTFERMWDSVGNQVTDMIFRVEQADSRATRSTWIGGTAQHASPSAASPSRQESVPGANAGSDAKPEPIRNRQQAIGRNDPCPCGSGKKYKQCCMRHG